MPQSKKNNEINIVWFKRDLRTIDNKSLEFVSKSGSPTLFIYIFEPSIIDSPDCDQRHIRFVYESLIDIKNNDIEIYPKDTRSNPDVTLSSALEFEKMEISLVIGPVFHKNLLFLDKIKNITFLSLTNKTLDLPKNIISSGINSSSQLNTIKKFLEKSEIKKTIFLIPNLNYDSEIKKGIKESKIKFFGGKID